VSEGSGERLHEGEDFAVASNPEFLREGSAVFDTLYPDRIVLGTKADWVRKRLIALYEPIISGRFAPPVGVLLSATSRPQGVPVVAVASEMIKYVANAFLSMKISFANELSSICELVGADVTRVTEGIGADERIGSKFLRAGVGWGGSCFGKDLSSLVYTAYEYGYRPLLLEAAQQVNDGQRQKVVQHVLDLLRPVKGRRVAVWGLAYKPETDDVRDSPASIVIRELLKLGVRVSANDPVATRNVQKSYPTFAAQYPSDALVILTEWREFQAISLADIARHLRSPIVIDGRNVFDPDSARRAGLIYRAMGRPMSALTSVLEG
jgi:UDPglucose 6-dehydrogenase